jgi:replicative DNA helicase
MSKSANKFKLVSSSDILFDQEPPNNKEAERFILGGILLNNKVINQAMEWVNPDDFFLHSHQHIYDRMLSMHSGGNGIDPITLQEELRKVDKLEEVGGGAYVGALFEGVPRFSDIENYVKIVKSKAILRRLALIGNHVIASAFSPDAEPEELITWATREIDALAFGLVKRGFVRVAEIAGSRLGVFEEAAAHGEVITGIPTGFSDLDYMLQGLHRGDLNIIAARPAMGKTVLGLNIAANVARQPGCVVGVCSLEMSQEQLVDRLLCSEARIDSFRLRSGHLRQEEWRRLAHAVGVLSDMELYIDDTPAMSSINMAAKARRLKNQLGRLDLLVIDYLQLMTSGQLRRDSRQEEVAAISRQLKGLAKDLEVPVVALAQLSRAPEVRSGNHKPQLSDLRESGGIEADADVVMFIYREEVYKPETEKQNIAEIIIGKQRNGPIGSVELVFLKSLTRFEDKFREGTTA